MVEPLLDGIGLLGPLDELFPDTPEEGWAPYRSRYPELLAGNSWRLPVMCFLLRADGRTVLVDTGAGPTSLWDDWMPDPESQEGLLPDLRRHGVEPEDVDVVFLTHDDIDHVGWNTQQDGSPTFPNARYLIHEDALERARATAGKRPHIPVCVLGLDDRIHKVRDGDEIADGLTVVALPGHARGHCGLVVEDDAVIVADAVPHPAQLDHPQWTFGYDADPELAIATRRRILDEFGDREIFLSHAREGVRL